MTATQILSHLNNGEVLTTTVKVPVKTELMPDGFVEFILTTRYSERDNAWQLLYKLAPDHTPNVLWELEGAGQFADELWKLSSNWKK